MQSGRAEPRVATNAVANLRAADEPSINETVVIANISEHGARVITGHSWRRGKQVIVRDSPVTFQTRAEVVYCAAYAGRQFAIGLRFNWSQRRGLLSLRLGQFKWYSRNTRCGA
jgi:hypothetical protein